MSDPKESITITKDFEGLKEAIQALASEKGYQNIPVINKLIHKVDLMEAIETVKRSKAETGKKLPKHLKSRLSKKLSKSEKSVENFFYSIDW